MGCYCGDLIISVVLVGGCEYIVVLEKGLDKEFFMRNIESGLCKGKCYVIIVIIELMIDVY